MRRVFLLPFFALMLVYAGCDTPTNTGSDFSVLGHWKTQEVDTLDVRMTLSETARSVAGAGSWVTASEASAFKVVGAHVGRSISLLFEFGDGPDVNFHGEFSETAGDSLTMVGELNGGRFRGTRILFEREIEEED